MTVGLLMLIDVGAAEPREHRCMAGERAPLSTKFAFAVAIRDITDGFARNWIKLVQTFSNWIKLDLIV